MKTYIRERIQEVLKLDEPPHRLSLAFSLGIFIAFSPWLGLHIVSAVFLAWMFRLNKVVVLTASFVNNPWTIVPMYAFCLWFGVKITRSNVQVPEIAWGSLGVRELYDLLLPFLWPYLAGTLAVGGVAAVFSYFGFLWTLKRYRREKAEG
ncbi:MAG: DUF2062 domain-containing protein [Nitrospirota bacterium]